jgi:GNAT superfamily N-acetyltransferase
VVDYTLASLFVKGFSGGKWDFRHYRFFRYIFIGWHSSDATPDFLLDGNEWVLWFLRSEIIPCYLKLHLDGPAIWDAIRKHKPDFRLSKNVLHHVEIVGFLRFVIQPIVLQHDHEPFFFDGDMLIEAKILAFGVASAQRRKGIGRALQNDALQRAKRFGCNQVRSHSGGDNSANHLLKLDMGFCIQPVVKGCS